MHSPQKRVPRKLWEDALAENVLPHVKRMDAPTRALLLMLLQYLNDNPISDVEGTFDLLLMTAYGNDEAQTRVRNVCAAIVAMTHTHDAVETAQQAVHTAAQQS